MTTKFLSQQPAGFVNYIKSVAIVGAGGRAGSQFAKALLDKGNHTVTAISRIGSTSKIDARAKVVNVDYEQRQTIVEALRNHDAVIITLNARMVKTEQSKIVEAAAEAGVPWILPNEFGFDPNDKSLGDDTYVEAPKRATRANIEALGLSWVGLINGFWYEYSLSVSENAFGFDMKNRKATFIDDGNTKQNTTTIPQMAQAMASLLSLKISPEDENDKSPNLSQFRNNFVYISSFLVSQQEMLDSILRVTGDNREDWTITNENHKDRFERSVNDLKQGKMEAFQRIMYTRVLYPNGEGEFSKRYPLSNELLGLPKLDLDECTAKALEMSKRGISTVID